MLIERDVLLKRRKHSSSIHEMPLLNGTLVFQHTLQLLLLFLKINVVLGCFYSLCCHTRDDSGHGEMERICGRFQRGLRAESRRIPTEKRDPRRGGWSSVLRRVREFEVELNRTDKVGFNPEFRMKEIYASVFTPNKGASNGGSLLVLRR